VTSESTEVEETYTTDESGVAYSSESAPTADTPARPATIAPAAATGRRKEAVARVRIVPGNGVWTINGRQLDSYFPNKLHQQVVNEPFAALQLEGRFDVIARIHGGGITGQAGALRLGVAFASTSSTRRPTGPRSRRPGCSRVTPASSSARRPASRRPARLRSTRSADLVPRPGHTVRFAHTLRAPRGVADACKTTPVWLRAGALRCTHTEHAKRDAASRSGH